MSAHGVSEVNGRCKRHGWVKAETWNIMDAGESA
jgi:hypothetical protein